MSWSEDFVKLLQSLQTAIKTTKCQSSLSAPCRCFSRYPYAEALRWWYHTIVNFNMAVQPSSIGSSTTMGEVWHHDAISIKRYWYLMSCTSIDIMFLSISVVSVTLERAGPIPLFSLYFSLLVSLSVWTLLLLHMLLCTFLLGSTGLSSAIFLKL